DVSASAIAAVGAGRPVTAMSPPPMHISPLSVAASNGVPSIPVQGHAPVGNFATTLPIPTAFHAVVPRPASPTRVESWPPDIDLLPADPGLKQIVELASTLANSASSVLIVGEPGTGKSLLAQLIHLSAGQPERPFVTLGAEEVEGGDSDIHENESED